VSVKIRGRRLACCICIRVNQAAAQLARSFSVYTILTGRKPSVSPRLSRRNCWQAALRPAGDPISIALAAIDETVTPRVYRYAGVGDTDMHYSASLLNVAAMYAAFPMRKSVNDFGASIIVPVPLPFLTQVAAACRSADRAGRAIAGDRPRSSRLPAAPEGDVVLTKSHTMFDVGPVDRQ
jgi:hypothetical protein